MAKTITLAKIAPQQATEAKPEFTSESVQVLHGGQAVPEGRIAFLIPASIKVTSLQQGDDKVARNGTTREGAIYTYLRIPSAAGGQTTAAIQIVGEDGEGITKNFRFGGFNAFMVKD